MNLEDIKKSVKMIQLAFGIQTDPEDLEMYSKLVLNRLQANNVILQEFNSAIAHFIDTKETNYKQLPTIGELLKFCNKQPKTVEQMAQEEASIAFNIGSDLKVRFKHPVTNFVVNNRCGGLDNFIQEYLCRYKEDKKSIPFKKKEFIEDWITAYENKNYSDDVLTCGGYIDNTEVRLIETHQQVEDMQNELLENKQNTIKFLRRF